MDNRFTHWLSVFFAPRKSLYIFLFTLICTVDAVSSFAQTITQSFTTAGNYTFTVPPCVHSIQVQCWGGGGGGGGGVSNPANDAGGGGGGGGYTINTLVAVTPGNTYPLVVGAGGTAATGAAGGNGGNSSFNGSVVAAGGTGGAIYDNFFSSGNGAGGAGGIGGTYNGGTGANGDHPNSGGGGGGGAGSGGNGSNGGTPTAGTAGAGGPGAQPGGAGGNGSSNATASTGIAPGGGGGGAFTANLITGTPESGGPGADGQVIITYVSPGPTITSVTGPGCPGSTITITGTNLGATTAAAIGTTLITGLHVSPNTVTGTVAPGSTTGLVTVTTTCGNAISTTSFNVNAAPAPVNLGTRSICTGSYNFGGRTYTTSGTYNDTATSATGCDSITTITLTIGTAVTQSISHTICSGGSYSFGGHSYSTAGTYNDTSTTGTGCDSITILTLSVNAAINQTINQNICAGTSYTFGGHSYNTTGTYHDTTSSLVTGCDSITTLSLSVNQVIYRGINWSICPGESYGFNGTNYSTSGTYVDTLFGAAANGCDSITALILTVLPEPTSTTIKSICHDSSYLFNGHTYLLPGIYADTLHAAGANGCDSIATLNLSLFNDTVVASATSLVYCYGDSTQICATQGFSTYIWNSGDTSACFYTTQLGRFWVSVTDGSGCPATSNLITVTTFAFDTAIITAQGDTLTSSPAASYQWYLNNQAIVGQTGQSIVGTQAGAYMVEITDSNGCHHNSVPYQLTISIGINHLTTYPEVKVFPNPLSSGSWFVEVGENMLGSSCELFDADGRCVYKSTINNLHFEIGPNVAKGIYILQLRSAEIAHNMKLIKLN